MSAKEFTVVTQLHYDNNKEIIDYIEEVLSIYSKAKRETFYDYRHDKVNGYRFSRSSYNTYLQNKYGILKKTANSIIADAMGTYNLLIEQRKYERNQLLIKIESLEKLISKLELERTLNSKALNEGSTFLLEAQRNLRKKIVSKKNKFNRYKQKLKNLNYQISTGNVKICFGTKDLLRKDFNAFLAKRDNQVYYMGDVSEKGCNRLLQLEYNSKNNQFDISLRRDFKDYKNVSDDEKYIKGRCYFKYYKKEITEILKTHSSPLTYRIIKRNGRYYLHCTFKITKNEDSILTRSNNGVIGLDFNKGHIDMTETNKYGHLVSTKFLPYRSRQGTKTQSDLEKIVSLVVKYALEKGKDISIEDLDFKKSKSKSQSKQGRKYNNMIHSLAYKKFSSILESSSYRNNVNLIKVNPAWTSWLGEKLYASRMKLNAHTSASYVIARRGQGYNDSVV